MVYRLGEAIPLVLENIYGPMLNEAGELPSLRKQTQQLMQNYEVVQHMFYEECMKLTENDLIREVLYPTLMGSKTPTSKCSESKEVRGDQLPIKVRLFN